MDRVTKIALIERTLALRHKLKVYDSMKAPETHEDLAVMLHSRWELEDELNAIEEIIGENRKGEVSEKKELIRKGVIKGKSFSKKLEKKGAKGASKSKSH